MLGVAATWSLAFPATSPSVYWGAYIEGPRTYGHIYGGSWRDAPWEAKTLARFERNVGKRVSIEHYGQPPPWVQGFDPATANLVERRGDINAIDMSTGRVPLSDIADGAYDKSLSSWAAAVKAWGHPLFLLLDEEMNGTWYPYSPGQNGNTADEFVVAWRHVHDVVTAAGATNVTWVWCPNVDPGRIFTPFDQLYPGDAYVDWTGLNGYNWGGRQWQSFASLFGSSYRELLRIAPSKPILIGEMASAEGGGSKAAWIADALAVQIPRAFPKIKAVLWFNWRIFEKDVWWPWQVESSARSQRAFKSAISSSYYAPGGRYPNLPLLTKIKPLN